MTGKIAFQGVAGAYSDLACRKAYPNMETLPCKTFEKAFQALSEKQAELAMIPVDNTIAGRVADVHHLIPGSGLYITGEHFQKIEHCLLGVKGARVEDIKYVHSHIHALPQCKKIIEELGLERVIAPDTAAAAKEVAERNDKEHAAISSSLAAKIYSLNILKENIQDEDHNTTRFLVLSRDHIVPGYDEGEDYITSFVFTVRNIPAALYKAMGGFATNGINMLKLESYVDKNFQAAQFYIDVAGHPDNKRLKLAMEELNFYASNIEHFGTYKADKFRKKA